MVTTMGSGAGAVGAAGLSLPHATVAAIVNQSNVLRIEPLPEEAAVYRFWERDDIRHDRNRFTAATLTSLPHQSALSADMVFEAQDVAGGDRRQYDPAPDGRLVMLREPASDSDTLPESILGARLFMP